jgi:hypothetical protein
MIQNNPVGGECGYLGADRETGAIPVHSGDITSHHMQRNLKIPSLIVFSGKRRLSGNTLA